MEKRSVSTNGLPRRIGGYALRALSTLRFWFRLVRLKIYKNLEIFHSYSGFSFKFKLDKISKIVIRPKPKPAKVQISPDRPDQNKPRK